MVLVSRSSKALSTTVILATLAAGLGSPGGSLHAAQLVYEGFNYRSGVMDTLVEGGGYGLVGSWFTQFGDAASLWDYRFQPVQ